MEMTIERQGSTTGRRGLRELFRTLEVLRELRPEMPIQMASVFLMIAMKPGIHQRDLPDMLGLSQSSISRNITTLAAATKPGAPGLGLVEQRLGGLGWKTPELHLTQAGKALARRLLGED